MTEQNKDKETFEQRRERLGVTKKQNAKCGFLTFTMNPIVVERLKASIEKKGWEVRTDFNESKLFGMRRIFEVTLRSLGYSPEEADRILGEYKELSKKK